MKPRWYDGYGLKGLKVFFLLLVQSLPPFTDDSQVIRGEFGFECVPVKKPPFVGTCVVQPYHFTPP